MSKVQAIRIELDKRLPYEDGTLPRHLMGIFLGRMISPKTADISSRFAYLSRRLLMERKFFTPKDRQDLITHLKGKISDVNGLVRQKGFTFSEEELKFWSDQLVKLDSLIQLL